MRGLRVIGVKENAGYATSQARKGRLFVQKARMIIKAAINGGRTKADHHAVPVTAREQALDIVECLEAGADAIHLHIRGQSGGESLYPDDVAETLHTVRSAAPGARLGISTGAWIML